MLSEMARDDIVRLRNAEGKWSSEEISHETVLEDLWEFFTLWYGEINLYQHEIKQV